MIGRRAAVGLALLCALLFAAFATSSAQAVKGTTAFTCVKVPAGEGTFADAHCKEPKAKGEYVHKEIKENETTKTHITNEKTSADTLSAESLTLRSNQLLIGETEITCSTLLGHGDLTNDKNEATKGHTIHGTKITLHYTGCKFVKPATCKVKNETILVEGVTATSAEQGDKLLFKPEVGTTFVTILAEKCGLTEFVVKGEVSGKENGATIEFDHEEITKEGKLTLNGRPAGLGGKVTVSQAEKTTALNDPESGLTGNPISSTTVET